MPQTRQTGARAREYGYAMAQRVADALGATLIRPWRSNEALWGSRKILIKSAHHQVSQIGATESTLERVDAIVAALQNPDGDYTLYELTTAWFRGEMHPSRSPRASHVMMVRCDSVRDVGRVIGRL